ncbi:MAG: hypothetical protein CMH53_05055 [Myxococcales bacterium]|nr:hypothetical protein [Myxococcales bacterium]
MPSPARASIFHAVWCRLDPPSLLLTRENPTMKEREVGLQLLAQARQRLEQGDAIVAAKIAERASDVLSEAADQSGACAALAVAGHGRMRAGELTAAQTLFESLVALAERFHLVAQALAARTDLGALLELAGQFDAALALHQELLDLCREAGDELGLANAAGNVGRLLTRAMQLQEAEVLLNESLRGFTAAQHALGQANAHICLGDLCRGQGRKDEAEAHFTNAVHLSQEGGAPPLHAVALLNLGHLLRDKSDHEAALEAFSSSAILCEGLHDAQGIARARLAEGLVLADLSMPDEALASFESAERAFVELGQPGGALAAAVNKAAVQCRTGALIEGKKVLERAHIILRDAGDPRARIEVSLALVEVHLALGDAGAAERLLGDLDVEALDARLQLKARMIESRLAMRALLLHDASRLMTDLKLTDFTPWERFSRLLVDAEVALLRQAPELQSLIDEMSALADEELTDREVAAARSLSAQAALWRGDVSEARQHYLRARALWRTLGEPMAESQSQAALWWIDLLNGEPLHPGEVQQLEDEVRQRGQIDQADVLACLGALASKARVGFEADAVDDEVLTFVAPLVHRGNRLGAAICLAFAAAVTSSDELRDQAADLAVGTQLSPPQLGRWAR